jgi:Protein of unknown function (DUF3500)
VPAQDSVPARETVGRLLGLLGPEQRSALCFAWDSPERTRWHYTPGARPGLPLRDMGEPARDAAVGLLRSALSEAGLASARTVMALEATLRRLEQRAGIAGHERRHPLHYWFAVFGDPDADDPWGWRVGGHHVNVHVTVVAETQVVLPLFLGANPATGPDGSRSLGTEEDLGRDLLASLDDDQRRRAVLSDEAPGDILTGNAIRAELAAVPVGIAFSELTTTQQARLGLLLDWYAGRSDPAASVHPEEATFAWLGSTQPGEPHYYAVRAGSVLVELDNTQDGANHVHTVLRDVDRDWGEDLLAAHYRERHR